ncbi:MAG: hypothetical protein QNJ04_00615 [Desulfobacterales bacterium]|nr:hypothetical protein [Desulfobacterales bacterium]
MESVTGDNSGYGFMIDPVFSRKETIGGEIPWASAAAWREGQLSLTRTIAASRAELNAAAALAGRIIHRYDLAGDLFDELADVTCETCRRPCCLDAKVWLDFKDLLLIHLSGREPPPAQLRGDWWGRCRYLTSNGCALPRTSRPWVCTWYICPDQRRSIARRLPGAPARLARWWSEIASWREQMENAFILAVHRPTGRFAAPRFDPKGLQS